MMIKKRDNSLQPLDITKIQKNTIAATKDLKGVNASELELDAQIKFIDGMSSADVQDALIKTAVDKIDIDVPNWTFVASRMFLYDLYHRVGRNTDGTKGKAYSSLAKYIDFCQKEEKMIPNLHNGYNLKELDNAIQPERDFLFNYLGIKTLHDRYLIKGKKGQVIELPQHMFMGIAMFLAQNEENKTEKAIEFYNIISQFEVMLATPTLSNARTNRHQLSSCYIGSSPDNIEGIFDGYKEMALLSKYGGGIGWDWNKIRALAGEIDNTPKAAGGTVPFLKITNDIAIAVDQLGTRKGAIAVYLEPWHMDIVDFIDLKKNSGEERRRAHDLFPALWISDLFMERVEANGDWTLFDPDEVKDLSDLTEDAFKLAYEAYESNENIRKETMRAKDLWKKILTSYFESGSPFLCFKDTANKANPNKHKGIIRSSNLCTEIFQNTDPNKYHIKIWVDDGKTWYSAKEDEDILLADGTFKKAKKITSLDVVRVPILDVNVLEEPKKVFCVEKHKIDGKTAVCNLASVNLSKINTEEDLERVIPVAMRMLDNVIDLNFYPLKKVKDTNLQTRAVGLGVMGEAQMLAEKGMYFGSQEHLDEIDSIMEIFSFNAIKASMELSKERGHYPDFKGSNWSKGIFPFNSTPEAVFNLTKDNTENEKEWSKLAADIQEHGMRNGYLMAIAPTSSISILVGTSQAIEPTYKRKWFEENLSGLIPVVAPNLSPDTYQYYTPAFEVDHISLIKAGAVRQKWIDQGQSLNVFMPLTKASGGYLNKIYTTAWKLGLKSTYYLRSESPEANNDVEDRSLECSGCQ